MLLNKINGDWWQVRKGFEEKIMYVLVLYMREIVERNIVLIYENVENFEIYCLCNGEFVISEENGLESCEEENSLIKENLILNGNNYFDYENNEGVENVEERLFRNFSEFFCFRSVLFSVKLFVKLLELVSLEVSLYGYIYFGLN